MITLERIVQLYNAVHCRVLKPPIYMYCRERCLEVSVSKSCEILMNKYWSGRVGGWVGLDSGLVKLFLESEYIRVSREI
jgi:hypothetical protein